MKRFSGTPVVILAAALVLGLAGCDDASRQVASPRSTPRSGASAETPRPRAGERSLRAPSMPPRPKVFFGEMGGFRAEIEQALEDLKRIGAWQDLTGHLYRVDVRVEPGRAAVKADRHLADARFWRARIARGTFRYPIGRFCFIRFFPAAMQADLARWESLYAEGVTGLVPPSTRQFWAAILGHELAHCPQEGARTTPEHVALGWESRILDALRQAGVE